MLFKKSSHVTFGLREDRVQVSHVLDLDSDSTDIPGSKRQELFHMDSELDDSFFVGKYISCSFPPNWNHLKILPER